jgi:hypothetical protein
MERREGGVAMVLEEGPGGTGERRPGPAQIVARLRIRVGGVDPGQQVRPFQERGGDPEVCLDDGAVGLGDFPPVEPVQDVRQVAAPASASPDRARAMAMATPTSVWPRPPAPGDGPELRSATGTRVRRFERADGKASGNPKVTGRFMEPAGVEPERQHTYGAKRAHAFISGGRQLERA